MKNSAKAFRDYATRVSFNLSLSRNQIGHLASLITEAELFKTQEAKNFDQRIPYMDAGDDACSAAGANPRMFVVAHRALEGMGLIERDPRAVADDNRSESARRKGALPPPRKYYGPTWRLTEAGEHVVILLRIAGLLPNAAANDRKDKAAAS